MRRDEILMIYGEDYQTMTKRLLCEAGLDTMIADKDASIGIKPNILGPYPAEDGGTTHPQIVAGIIEYLKEHGFHKPTVAEGSWVGDYTREAFCVADMRIWQNSMRLICWIPSRILSMNRTVAGRRCISVTACGS